MGIRGTKRLNDLSNKHLGEGQPLLTSVDNLIKIAEEKGLYKDDRLDIEKLILLSMKDIEIKYVTLDNNISGSLSREGNKWIIKINKGHSENRKRFTLGHELAHYILHKSESENFIDTIFFRGISINNIERAANEFAAKLLMPEKKIKSLVNEKQIRNVGDLANQFGVSAAAMLYRVKQIGFKTK